MAKKESCPKCGSTIFALAKDKSGKHYCQAKGCGNVWVPGMENLKRTDVVIRQLQTENRELKEALAAVRRENRELKEEMALMKGDAAPTSDEIFS